MRKPIFKRWWFWVIIVVIIFGIIGSSGSDSEPSADAGTKADSEANTDAATTPSPSKKPPKKEPDPIEYTAYTVDEMMDTLESNALKAESLYNKQYVEITGRLSVIDASGKYISLLPVNDDWAFIGVTCYIKNAEQREQIMEMSTDDTVTLRGKITDVGEVLGYSLDIDEIICEDISGSGFDFEIIAGEAGEYGKSLVYNKDTEFEETIIAYYIPAGTYTITNIGDNSDQLNICSDEKAVSAAGWEEPAEAVAKLVDAGESATLTISDGQHIEITAPGHWGFKAE